MIHEAPPFVGSACQIARRHPATHSYTYRIWCISGPRFGRTSPHFCEQRGGVTRAQLPTLKREVSFLLRDPPTRCAQQTCEEATVDMCRGHNLRYRTHAATPMKSGVWPAKFGLCTPARCPLALCIQSESRVGCAPLGMAHRSQATATAFCYVRSVSNSMTLWLDHPLCRGRLKHRSSAKDSQKRFHTPLKEISSLLEHVGPSFRLPPNLRNLPCLSRHSRQVLSTMAHADRHALIALYNATGGASWHQNENWDMDADFSQWHGVKANDQGRLVAMSLSLNYLRGILTCSS